MNYSDPQQQQYAAWYQQQAESWNSMMQQQQSYGSYANSSNYAGGSGGYQQQPQQQQPQFDPYRQQSFGAYGYGTDPSAAAAGSGTQYNSGNQVTYNPSLWIGDLEDYMDEYFLRNAFAALGETLQGVRIIRDRKTGARCNYGFLQFADHETAKRVHLKYNNKMVPNSSPPRRFKLNEAQFNKSADPVNSGIQSQEYSLFIGDLTPDVDDYQLYQTFSVYPSCKGARVVCDQDGNSKGYGFVRFASETDQQRALIEMAWYKGCGGKALRVSRATSKTKGGVPIRQPGAGAPGAMPPAMAPPPAAGMPPTSHQQYQQWAASAWGAQPHPTAPSPAAGYGGYYYPDSDPQQQQPGQAAGAYSGKPSQKPDHSLQLVEHDPPFDVDVENFKYMKNSEELYEALERASWGMELPVAAPTLAVAHT